MVLSMKKYAVANLDNESNIVKVVYASNDKDAICVALDRDVNDFLVEYVDIIELKTILEEESRDSIIISMPVVL